MLEHCCMTKAHEIRTQEDFKRRVCCLKNWISFLCCAEHYTQEWLKLDNLDSMTYNIAFYFSTLSCVMWLSLH